MSIKDILDKYNLEDSTGNIASALKEVHDNAVDLCLKHAQVRNAMLQRESLEKVKDLLSSKNISKDTHSKKLIPIFRISAMKRGSLMCSYDDIVEKLGPPNATKLTPPEMEIKAYWAFSDESGREIFIWNRRIKNAPVENCRFWEIDGNFELFKELEFEI